MPVPLSEDFFEVLPEHEEVLLLPSRIVYAGLYGCTRPDMLYDKEEIYKALKGMGMDDQLHGFSFGSLMRFHQRDTQGKLAFVSLQLTLRNLWCCDAMIRKYAKGYHGMSGGPIGVHWRIK